MLKSFFIFIFFVFLLLSCTDKKLEKSGDAVFKNAEKESTDDAFYKNYAKHGIKELKIDIDGGKKYRLVEFADGRVHIEGLTDPKKLNIQSVYGAVSAIRATPLSSMPIESEDFYVTEDGLKLKLPKAKIDIIFSGGIEEKLELTGLRRPGSDSIIAKKGDVLMEIPVKDALAVISMEKDN